jgi:hypothetical protein
VKLYKVNDKPVVIAVVRHSFDGSYRTEPVHIASSYEKGQEFLDKLAKDNPSYYWTSIQLGAKLLVEFGDFSYSNDEPFAHYYMQRMFVNRHMYSGRKIK